MAVAHWPVLPLSPHIAEERIETLGEVTAPSGILLLIDTGYLNLWSHDRPPRLPEGVLPDAETTARANRSADVRVEGPDALEAGKAFDRSWNPHYVFDASPESVAPGGTLSQAFAELVTTRGFNARLVPQAAIPHRQRVDLALEYGLGAGEVQYHGMWASVIGSVPKDRALPIVGVRIVDGECEGRWQRVWVECGSGEVSCSERVGLVMVDWARLMVADVEAIGAWQHDEPLDGRADFVFWGRDAAELAQQCSAGQLDEKHFGWLDLPVEETARLGYTVEKMKASTGLKAATDFRPHSHHYAIMSEVRSSETESGVIDLAGARLCSFMTSWGDGIFEVYRDFNSAGDLVRIRIEMGTPDRVELLREVWRRAERDAKSAFVSNRVWRDGQPIRWLYRDPPDRDADSGWRVFAGDELDEYNDDSRNISLVSVGQLLERDGSLKAVIDAEPGSAFERRAQTEAFASVTDWHPSD